ncbi:MAG: glycosyltransferase family 39 protein, partial [Thiohalocapsa sp.]
MPAVIIVVTVARLAVASVLPVTQDEAYYYHWAHHLAWGYYDHPPGVALLGLGALLEPASALAARLGALCAATATLFVLWRLYLLCGLSSLQQTLALTLAATSMPGLVSGIITTPDSALGLCWALALHEGAVALRGDRRRWMSAGLATGLGLLGKYTMVIIGPVFLWALLRSDPRALRSPWPYLGAAAVLVVFAPQLWWNAENDWLTLRFQFGHGF